MTKINFGQLKLDIDEYKNFLLGGTKGGYILPVRKGRIYVASELPEFFQRAQAELENLLSQITTKKEPEIVSDREKITHEFHLLSHGKTGTNSKGQLTGWSGDMPCHTYEKGGKHELGGIELALAQAGIMPEDEVSRELIEKLRVQKIDLGDFYLRFTSDLPRAIGHALLLTGDKRIAKEIDMIDKRIHREIGNNGNIYDVTIYHDLMNLALENGFIVTPLLRAQYYGPMELGPEKLKPEDKDASVEEMVQKTRQNFTDAKRGSQFNESKAREEAEDLANALIKRKNLLFAHRDEGGNYLTEDRLDLFHRLGHFYDPLYKLTSGKILAVTSSGCTEISPSHARYVEQGRKDLVIVTPKKKVRGKVVAIKFGKYDGKDCYLNDPKKLHPIRQKAREDIAHFRGRSIDRLIKEEGKGILETPLVGFREKKGEDGYERYPEKLIGCIRSPHKVIIFAHGGQGKTILMTEIARKFLDGEFGEEYLNHVPIMFNCGNLNEAASSNRDAYNGDPRIESIIREQTQGLPLTLLEESKFVFMIDDYQKLSTDYTRAMEETTGKLKSEGNLVILFSRLERTDVHPPHNLGYKTMQIDTDAVAEQTDEFIEGRIHPNHIERFKDYLKQYDPSVTGHYLTKLFLTMIFPTGNGETKGVVDYVMDPEIQQAIREGKPLSKTELFEAHTDYQTACDIKKIHPDWGIEQVREEAVKWKDQLAEKIFNDVFGPEKK